MNARFPGLIVAAGLAAALGSAPVQAGWKQLPAGTPVKVGPLSVTPSTDWNQASAKLGQQGVAWTHDGFELNAFETFAGVPVGGSLYKERNRKRNPMPKFDATILLPELADFFERSFRAQHGVTDFVVEEAGPVEFAGTRGLQVRYRYTLPNDELARQGIARLAVIDKRLFATNFYAPSVHYFAAGLPEAETLMTKARR